MRANSQKYENVKKVSLMYFQEPGTFLSLSSEKVFIEFETEVDWLFNCRSPLCPVRAHLHSNCTCFCTYWRSLKSFGKWNCTTQHCSNWIIFALTIALNFLQWHSTKSQSQPQPQHQTACSHLRWIAQRWAGRWLNGAKSSSMVQSSVQFFLCSL